MANIITVTALNRYVRSILESDVVLTDIAIKGEISNFNKHYKTGHCYFSLKDGESSVKAVLFRSAADRLAFLPENGMSVVARGRISLYERDGAFQVYVADLFPDGVGAAQMAFEQLKARLQAEGLFAPDHKQALPPFPQKIGLVTSKTGAALQDILKVAGRRDPSAHFVLAPVTVQGMAAAPEIAKAIQLLDEQGGTDVIIVARGGGSAEDLWVFNSEEIARAVFRCKTPVVSAIGHEIDFTILDFVADMRAPTPSAAAEMVLPDMASSHAYMMNLYTQITNSMHLKINSWYNRVAACKNSPVLAGIAKYPKEQGDRLQELKKMHRFLMENKLARSEQGLVSGISLAESLNPYSVMARGYSIAQNNGTTIKSIHQVNPGEEIKVIVRDGSLCCTIQEVISSAAQESHNGEKERSKL